MSSYHIISIFQGITVGLALSLAILNVIGGSYFYLAARGIFVILSLGRYRYKLFVANPSNSEIVDSLAHLFNAGVYISGIWAASYTVLIVWIGGINSVGIVLMIILGWGPPTAIFIVSQYTLGKIIGNAKWMTLNGIQAQIEALQTNEQILSEETLGHLNKLMDYHDRIVATPNSALSFRAGLNFLNSLLLPVIALLLANLNQIIELFLEWRS